VSSATEWDRRRSDADRWRELGERLDKMDERLAVIEGKATDDAARRRHIREFFEDFGRWVGYGGKLVASLIAIGGAAIALVAWMARNG
jgi:hypothetical protein